LRGKEAEAEENKHPFCLGLGGRIWLWLFSVLCIVGFLRWANYCRVYIFSRIIFKFKAKPWTEVEKMKNKWKKTTGNQPTSFSFQAVLILDWK
jgi:hypothetical protein